MIAKLSDQTAVVFCQWTRREQRTSSKVVVVLEIVIGTRLEMNGPTIKYNNYKNRISVSPNLFLTFFFKICKKGQSNIE